MEKKVYRQTNQHNYRKGKNYIPPTYFVPRHKYGVNTHEIKNYGGEIPTGPNPYLDHCME